jgi:hypothetical protein
MMRRGLSMVLTELVVLLFVGSVIAADRQLEDSVTQQLFDQYIARQGKIDSESIKAATHLVAVRGRGTGFWKTVLAELKRGNEHSEIGCVRVLGKMLAIDAAARDVIRRQEETGVVSAWAASVCLGPEVVTELIERGGKADRFRIDHYTIALARARMPQARDFFKSILNAGSSQSGPYVTQPIPDRDATQPPTATPGKLVETAPASMNHLDSTRFHAAVGLAQLGESTGIDWLIEHCEHCEGSVMHAWPVGATRGGDLCACCQEALRHLSGEQSLKSKAEWTQWSKSIGKKFWLDQAVVFGDP